MMITAIVVAIVLALIGALLILIGWSGLRDDSDGAIGLKASFYLGVALLVIAGAIVVTISMRPAHAHGDASWIMQNPSTAYCCGPSDCERLPKEAVKILGSGYGVTIQGQQVVVAYGKELKSKDDDYWACIPPGQPLKCFFAPPLGA